MTRDTRRLAIGALATTLLCGLPVLLSTALAVPGGGTLYGTDASGGNLLTIDPNGDGTVVGPMGAGVIPALAVDPNGIIYAGGGGGTPNVYTVDPNSGVATLVGDSGLGLAAFGGMDFDPNGTLFAAVNIVGDGGTGSDHLATVDKGTGVATVIGPFGVCGFPCTIEGMEAIAFDAGGRLWGAVNPKGAGGTPGLYRIDRTTGAASFLVPIEDPNGVAPPGGIVSLQFGCDGTLFGGTAQTSPGNFDGGRLVTIDPATGVFSFVGANSATGGTSLGALAFAAPCPLDHFLCYKTKGKQTLSVTLTDQFDTGTYEGKKAKVLCTPADKAGSGTSDANVHLKGYKIKGPHAPRTGVLVTNQFGTFSFDTKKTDGLLVPTSKSLSPAPPPGAPDPNNHLVDHFRCLKARITPGTTKFPKGIVVTVADQLGTRQVQVKRPTKLCLPADKNGEGIKRPAEHLMCYRIKADPKTSTTGVQVNNQIGPEVLDLKREVDLCVPSSKS